MAIFNITAGRSNATVTPLAAGTFDISTLVSNRCIASQSFQAVDNLGYFTTVSLVYTDPNVGDVIYSDVAKTILYNTSGAIRDYNINNGLFISLDAASKVILNHCK